MIKRIQSAGVNMAKRDGVQGRLGKVRPPRVHLTYDVQVGDAIEKKELPFVLGVLGDFSGNSEAGRDARKLKDRKFVDIDLDNFDDVLAGISPKSSHRVKNRLSPDGGEMVVDLEFRSMDDFRPESIVRRVEPLRRLVEARSRLADLRNKLAGNDRLEDLLADALSNAEKLERLHAESKG